MKLANSDGGANAAASQTAASAPPSSTTVAADSHHASRFSKDSAVRNMLPYIIGGLCILQGGYWILYHAYKNDVRWILQLPRPAPEFCQDTKNRCGRPDLFAFQIMSGITFIGCGGLAFYIWYISRSMHQKLYASTPETRLFAHHEAAQWITVINFTYQVWDFAISWTIPEHCTMIMMTHHFVAAVLNYTALDNRMLGYYPTFFVGLSEVSSIFLVMIDLAKYFQPRPGSVFDFVVNSIAGPAFVVCFLFYRVIRWWPISIQLYADVYHIVQSNKYRHFMRPGQTWVLYMWVILNLPMGLLQLYWVTIILQESMKWLQKTPESVSDAIL
jgi:hypothetical protein